MKRRILISVLVTLLVPAIAYGLVQIKDSTGAVVDEITLDAVGALPTAVFSSALPAGAATETKQDDAITIAGTSDAFLNNIEGSAGDIAAQTPTLITGHGVDRTPIAIVGHECLTNGTATNLGGGATFTGTWEDSINYGVLVVGVKADQDSATDGLVVEWSPDGVTAVDSDVYTISATKGKVFSWTPSARYFKVSYTNGAAPQTSFYLQTMVRPGFKGSSHRINNAIVAEDDAELTKAVLSGQNVTTDIFGNVHTVNGGSLLVSNEARGVAIAKGLVPGSTAVKKFGHNSTVGAAWELIWEGSAVYDYLSAEETFVIKSDSVEDDPDKGGAVAGTGAHTVEVSCVNQAWAEVIQTVTLNGTAAVSVSGGDCMIAYRSEVKTAGTSGYNVGTITLYQADGVTAQCHVTPTNNQSLMAHMPVFAGHTMRINYVHLSEVGNKETEVGIFVRATPTGLFALKQHFTLLDSAVDRVADVPNQLPAQAIIAVRARASVGGAKVSANFDAIMEAVAP